MLDKQFGLSLGQSPYFAAGDCQIYDNAEIGEGTVIEGPAIVGKPARGHKAGEQPTKLGRDCRIRPFSTVYAGSLIGDRLETGQGVTIREDNRLGDDVSVGTNTTLEFGNLVGNRVRIHSGCFLEQAEIGNDVFIGPNVVFTDDPHPMGCPRYKECLGGVKVGDFARVGANATILPGVRIGNNALVGAGSVVVRDVPDNAVVVGNPAKVVKTVIQMKCHAGFYDRPYVWLNNGRIQES